MFHHTSQGLPDFEFAVSVTRNTLLVMRLMLSQIAFDRLQMWLVLWPCRWKVQEGRARVSADEASRLLGSGVQAYLIQYVRCLWC